MSDNVTLCSPPSVGVRDRVNGSYKEGRKEGVCVCVCAWKLSIAATEFLGSPTGRFRIFGKGVLVKATRERQRAREREQEREIE